MVDRKPLIGTLLAVTIAYGGYPYVTLYRLGQAVRDGNASTLESIVDWSSVREGIKEDICDLVIDPPQQTLTSSQLPPFGAGFVRGIAANVVDRRVTPEGLVAAARQPDVSRSPRGDAMQVSWAFFASPAAFTVDLNSPGQSAPIRLQMELRYGTWHVTRVWLPPEMLAHANAGT